MRPLSCWAAGTGCSERMMDHQDVISTVANALKDAPGIRALFLSGSYGNGMADAYSDIDFVMVAEDGASAVVGPQACARLDQRNHRGLDAHRCDYPETGPDAGTYAKQPEGAV